MKKYLILLLSLIILGCSNAANSSDEGNTKTFTPYQLTETNSSSDYIRQMHEVSSLNKATVDSFIELNNQSSNSNDGIAGTAILFDNSSVIPNTYNILLVGIKNESGSLQSYASFYCNIPDNNLLRGNFGVSTIKETYDSSCTDPYELEIVSASNATEPEAGQTNVLISQDYYWYRETVYFDEIPENIPSAAKNLYAYSKINPACTFDTAYSFYY